VLGDTASPFAPFEHRRFMCHDLHEDDVSNEPALDSNSNLLAALARRGAMAIADSARNMMLTRQQISKIDASADIATPQSVCNGTAGRLATERECRTPERPERGRSMLDSSDGARGQAIAVLGLLLSLVGAPGCGGGGSGGGTGNQASTSWVHHWNHVAIDASGLDHTPVTSGDTRVFGEVLGPGRASRAMAIIHITVFEAVNAIAGGYQSYTNLPRARAGTSMQAAMGRETGRRTPARRE